MTRVAAVGLRPSLRPSQRRCLGRLRQMRPHAGALKLLNDEAPARTRLHRKGRLPIGDPSQPGPQVLTIGWSDPATTDLTALGVHVLECDLATVKIQPTNDRHDNPLPARGRE